MEKTGSKGRAPKLDKQTEEDLIAANQRNAEWLICQAA